MDVYHFSGLHTATTALMISKLSRVLALVCVLVLNGSLEACATSNAADADSPDAQMIEAKAATFSNPQAVTIVGYSQDAMEPFITRDGNFLFFNNSNDPSVDTNLYWASKVDDLTFQFQGEIGGVNSTALDAVPSMDLSNNFYFVSTRSYDTTLSTIYSGSYANGSVAGVGIVPGVSAMERGLIDFDEEISADGNTLYFTEGVFTGASVPQSSEIIIARRSGGTFVRDPNSKKILKKINSGGKLNYAADTSADELELFFTRFSGKEPAIYMSGRMSTSLPFGVPQKIRAITGFAEAPSISPDGKSLYFHMKNRHGVFSIYRVMRP